MMEQNEQNTRTFEERKASPIGQLLGLLAQLPGPLASRVMKNVGVGLLFAVFTLFLLINLRSFALCFGFVISAYIIWLGIDIMFKYRNGKIICRRMQCKEVTRFLKTKKLVVIAQELEFKGDPAKAIHEFYVEATKREIKLLKKGLVMNAYFDPSNPLELTAWEIVDYV